MRAALAAMIESGPMPALHGVVRWRLIDLCQGLWEEFRVSIAKQTPSRALRAMRFRKLSRVRAIMRRQTERLSILNKFPRHSGGDRARQGHRGR
jgi:hypothetical protein